LMSDRPCSRTRAVSLVGLAATRQPPRSRALRQFRGSSEPASRSYHSNVLPRSTRRRRLPFLVTQARRSSAEGRATNGVVAAAASALATLADRMSARRRAIHRAASYDDLLVHSVVTKSRVVSRNPCVLTPSNVAVARSTTPLGVESASDAYQEKVRPAATTKRRLPRWMS